MVVQNNSIIECNAGRAAAVYGIRIGADNDPANGGTYPAESAKIIVDTNSTDAAVELFNPSSVTTVSTRSHDFPNTITGDGDVDIGGDYKVSGTALAMTHLSDGASYSTTVQRNLHASFGRKHAKAG